MANGTSYSLVHTVTRVVASPPDIAVPALGYYGPAPPGLAHQVRTAITTGWVWVAKAIVTIAKLRL